MFWRYGIFFKTMDLTTYYDHVQTMIADGSGSHAVFILVNQENSSGTVAPLSKMLLAVSIHACRAVFPTRARCTRDECDVMVLHRHCDHLLRPACLSSVIGLGLSSKPFVVIRRN